MKTFFSRFLACLLALVVFSVFGLILFFASLVAIPAILNSKPKEKLTAPAYILSIHSDNLWGERADQNTTDKLKNVLGKTGDLGLSDFIRAIEHAKTDKNIRSIYLELGFTPNSYATIYRMRKALVDFKQSGKKIYAFARNMTPKSYLLATVADSVLLSHEATFLWDGLGNNLVFFKGFLDKIGLDMQIFYAGKFKSATEPFRRSSMSEENQIQQRAILQFFHDSLLNSVARDRHITPAKLNEYADNLSLRNAKLAYNLGMVDGICSWEELDQTLRQGLPKGTARLDIKKYLSHISPPEALATHQDEIAVIYADGEIIANGTGILPQGKAIEGTRFAKCIRKLAGDSSVKGVVLRINSPGGSVSSSEEIYDALQYLRKSKPVVVSMGSVAASGGYYIACASDYIVADPYCLTGSIGVFAMVPNVEGGLQKNLGLSFDGIKTNRNTFMGTQLSPAQRSFLQFQVEDIYAQFKEKVAKARHLSASAVENLAQGRVWVAPEALRLGLVDELGTLPQAIAKVAALAKLSPDSYKVGDYPESESLFEQLLADSHYGIELLTRIYRCFNPKSSAWEPSNLSELIARSYSQWAQLSKQPQLLMRMPYDMDSGWQNY